MVRIGVHIDGADPLAGASARGADAVARELADIVADELTPVRAGDEVDFIFGVIIPARDVAWTIVLMPLERLRRISDDRFKVRESGRAFPPRHVSFL